MPLARIILSMSQRCSSKRRTRGGPRRSRMGGKPCCGRFMRFLRWRPVRAGGGGRLQRYYRRGACLVVNDAAAIIGLNVRSRVLVAYGGADAGSTLSAPDLTMYCILTPKKKSIR